jgi:hypothetical protein
MRQCCIALLALFGPHFRRITLGRHPTLPFFRQFSSAAKCRIHSQHDLMPRKAGIRVEANRVLVPWH